MHTFVVLDALDASNALAFAFAKFLVVVGIIASGRPPSQRHPTMSCCFFLDTARASLQVSACRRLGHPSSFDTCFLPWNITTVDP